jgi:hypothetical protein
LFASGAVSARLLAALKTVPRPRKSRLYARLNVLDVPFSVALRSAPARLNDSSKAACSSKFDGLAMRVRYLGKVTSGDALGGADGRNGPVKAGDTLLSNAVREDSD